MRKTEFSQNSNMSGWMWMHHSLVPLSRRTRSELRSCTGNREGVSEAKVWLPDQHEVFQCSTASMLAPQNKKKWSLQQVSAGC